MPWTLEQVIGTLATGKRATEALSPADFESATAAGHAMSLDDAMTYVDDTVERIRLAAGEPE